MAKTKTQRRRKMSRRTRSRRAGTTPHPKLSSNPALAAVQQKVLDLASLASSAGIQKPAPTAKQLQRQKEKAKQREQLQFDKVLSGKTKPSQNSYFKSNPGNGDASAARARGFQ